MTNSPIDWYAYKSSLWVIACKPAIVSGSACEDARALANVAFVKAGGLKGGWRRSETILPTPKVPSYRALFAKIRIYYQT